MTGLQASNLGANARPLSRIPICGYSPAPTDPTTPLCGRPAAAHITPLDRGRQANWTILACAHHAPLASDNAWDWHPLTENCSRPGHAWTQGTVFHTSSCAMPRQQAGIA